LQRADVPAAHLLVIPREHLDSKLPSIEDALELYLAVKGQSKGKLFFSHAKRNVSYVVACLGSRPLDCYSSADAATFRQWLSDKGLGSTSVIRVFSVIKAIINFCIKEQGLDCKNAFSGVYLPSENNKKKIPGEGFQVENITARVCFVR
jgi:site-specific recombinase XerC